MVFDADQFDSGPRKPVPASVSVQSAKKSTSSPWNVARQPDRLQPRTGVWRAARAGESFGRYINSLGEEQFPPQLSIPWALTIWALVSAQSSSAKFLDILLRWIFPFVELCNIAPVPVLLYDGLSPTNTWRVGGIDFSFPANTSIQTPRASVLTTADPSSFRSQYNVPPGIQIFRYSGSARTNGEALELLSPDAPGTNGVPYFVVDRIHSGIPPILEPRPNLFLQRIDLSAYGGRSHQLASRETHTGANPVLSGPTFAI